MELYEAFSSWLLSLSKMHLRFIRVVMNSSLFFIAKWHFIECVYHIVCPFISKEPLDYFQFWVLINKAGINIYMQILWEHKF